MGAPKLRFRLRTQMIALVLIALAFWVVLLVGAAREAGARTQCANNLRQIGLSILNYSSSYDVFPPGTVINQALPPTQRLSWWALISAYIEQGSSLVYDPNEPWNGGINRVPTCRFWSTDGNPPPYTAPAGDFPLVQCPAHRRPSPPTVACTTDYVGIAGLGTDAPSLPTSDPRAGVFGYDRFVRATDIKDGLATTMALVETASANGPWTAGGPPTVRGLDPSRTPYVGPGRQFGGIHKGGANVAFADGSVRFVREGIDPKIFEALSTIAGHEPVPDGWEQ